MQTDLQLRVITV